MKNKFLLFLISFLSLKIFSLDITSFTDIIKQLDFYEDSTQKRLDSLLLTDHTDETLNYMIDKLKSKDWYFKTIAVRILKKYEDKGKLFSLLDENNVERLYFFKIFEDRVEYLEPFSNDDFKTYELSSYINYLEKKKDIAKLISFLGQNVNDYIIIKALDGITSLYEDSISNYYVKENYDVFKNLIQKKNTRINKSLSKLLSKYFEDSLSLFFNEKSLNDVSNFSLYIETLTLLEKKVDLKLLENFYSKFRTKDYFYMDYVLKNYFMSLKREDLEIITKDIVNKKIKDIMIEVIGEKNG